MTQKAAQITAPPIRAQHYGRVCVCVCVADGAKYRETFRSSCVVPTTIKLTFFPRGAKEEVRVCVRQSRGPQQERETEEKLFI